MPDPYVILLAGFGALVLLTAWLPMLLHAAPLSLPVASVALGAVLFAISGEPGTPNHPNEHLRLIERLTEFVVIVSLMGAGLKLDRELGWRSWRLTWRLLGVSMPLTIAALALLAYGLLGLGVATALLLASALAPTDPVLASDVQVGPPGSGEEDETRFALTSEAGLNDALAFPFVQAAIAISLASASGEPWLWKWISTYVVWKITAGIALGYLVGRALGWLLFHIPSRANLSRTGDGFVVLGMTTLAYALTEIAGGYGFLAVFVAALAVRAAERQHEFHERLHDFAEQLERLLMVVLLVLFGGALWNGDLFRALSWQAVLFGLLALFLVRPLAGWIGLAMTLCPPTERAVISFYGIRGLGSVYYLAFALQKAQFEAADLLWSAVSFIILVSIVLHGVTVTPVMRYLDWRQRTGRTLAEMKRLELP
jgi:sodium/hydrogen antiporter